MNERSAARTRPRLASRARRALGSAFRGPALDEARWHDEDLAEQFAKLTGFHEHAFWTLLERPKYWTGALAFHHADSVPFSYGRKRKNVPRKPASGEPAGVRQLEQNLSDHFRKMQSGRALQGGLLPTRREA